jgi:TPR repeat protein
MLLVLLAATAPGRLAAQTTPGMDTAPPSAETLADLEKLAKGGNAKAQNQLGTYYFIRSLAGENKDYPLAVTWFELAAAQNEAHALFNLGVCYERGLGVTKDLKRALEYYRQAADLGLEKAQLNCALTLQEMRGNAEAARYFEMAAKQGNVVCQREFGRMLVLGTGVPQDTRRGLDFLERAANNGDTTAQLFLAECYAGQHAGVTPDAERMVDFLWLAAGRDVPEAFAKIAFCYEEGLGLAKDTTLAVRWYQQALDRGYAQAAINLGHCYAVGRGVPQDQRKAFELYQRAADLNLPLGHYNLGVAYALGEGVAIDEQRAFTHFQIAAQAGLMRAQYNLGVSYEEGRGTEADLPKAYHWYRLAAEQGDDNACVALAWCLWRGRGTAVDQEQARQWMQKAAQRQHPAALAGLAEMAAPAP